MYDERIETIIQENPQLEFIRRIIDNGIVIIPPNVEKYQNDPEQLLVMGYSGKKTISKQLVIDIMQHDDSYAKVLKLFEENLYGMQVVFFGEHGEFINQYGFSRMVIIDLLRKLDANAVEQIKERYNQIMDYVSYEKLVEKTKNERYSIIIDGKIYDIPVEIIYQFMGLSDEAFKGVIMSGKDVNGIPLPHFLHAVSKYYEVNNIVGNYLLSDIIEKRLDEIESSKIVDVEMINKYLDAYDPFIKKIHVDDELVNSILIDMNPEFSDPEKAIYVYIKMCKLLTYDEEFFAVDQHGPFAEKHKKLENISLITPTNNKVVCYEFDAIYGYILNKLGINYRHFIGLRNRVNGIMTEEPMSEEFYRYSEGHTFLKCRCGKYLIKADSVTTILQGDIMQAKLNQPLKGLVCENVNEQSREEFNTMLYKVYNYIASREPRISTNNVCEVETFDDVVQQFTESTDKLKPIDIREKIDILIRKVNSTNMIGVDAYSYLLQLKKILFTPLEQELNIKISIIRNSSENSAEALGIISTRIPDENGGLPVTRRYMYRPGSGLELISRSDLQLNFDNKTMGYITDDDPVIPGITK